MTPNLLYYGDNLDVLRRHVKDESEWSYAKQPGIPHQSALVLGRSHMKPHDRRETDT